VSCVVWCCSCCVFVCVTRVSSEYGFYQFLYHRASLSLYTRRSELRLIVKNDQYVDQYSHATRSTDLKIERYIYS